MDGGEFIKYLLEKVDEENNHIDHFYMNLPALNIEFLPFFKTVPIKMLSRGFWIHLTTF